MGSLDDRGMEEKMELVDVEEEEDDEVGPTPAEAGLQSKVEKREILLQIRSNHKHPFMDWDNYEIHLCAIDFCANDAS